MADTWESLRQECLACRAAPWRRSGPMWFSATVPPTPRSCWWERAPASTRTSRAFPLWERPVCCWTTCWKIIGLDRTKVYIANIVKCRPPGNRDPLNVEQDACIGFLRRRRAAAAQNSHLPGRIAAKAIIDENFRITSQHGQWFARGGVQMTAIYHPAALLRDVSKRPETFEDLKSIQAKVRELFGPDGP